MSSSQLVHRLRQPICGCNTLYLLIEGITHLNHWDSCNNFLNGTWLMLSKNYSMLIDCLIREIETQRL